MTSNAPAVSGTHEVVVSNPPVVKAPANGEVLAQANLPQPTQVEDTNTRTKSEATQPARTAAPAPPNVQTGIVAPKPPTQGKTLRIVAIVAAAAAFGGLLLLLRRRPQPTARGSLITRSLEREQEK